MHTMSMWRALCGWEQLLWKEAPLQIVKNILTSLLFYVHICIVLFVRVCM
jgi:hypothetical protein